MLRRARKFSLCTLFLRYTRVRCIHKQVQPSSLAVRPGQIHSMYPPACQALQKNIYLSGGVRCSNPVWSPLNAGSWDTSSFISPRPGKNQTRFCTHFNFRSIKMTQKLKTWLPAYLKCLSITFWEHLSDSNPRNQTLQWSSPWCVKPLALLFRGGFRRGTRGAGSESGPPWKELWIRHIQHSFWWLCFFPLPLIQKWQHAS